MSFSHSKLNKVQEPQLCSHWVPTKKANFTATKNPAKTQAVTRPTSAKFLSLTGCDQRVPLSAWTSGANVWHAAWQPDSYHQWWQPMAWGSWEHQTWRAVNSRWEGRRIWGWSLWRTFRLGRCRFYYYAYSSWLISTVYCESTLTCESVRIHVAVFMCLAILVMTTVHILSLHKRITDPTDLVCCSHCYILNFWKEIYSQGMLRSTALVDGWVMMAGWWHWI